MQSPTSRQHDAVRAPAPEGVDCPPPDALVAAVHERLAGRARRPLTVLDPRWPPGLRARAVAGLTQAEAAGRLTADDLVLFTSGSSGSPRAVVRTVESWRSSLRPLSTISTIGLPDVDPDVVWVPGPLTSTLFLYGAAHASWYGLRWVRGRPDAPAVQAATAAHLVPTQLIAALASRERGLLPRLRTVVVTGAALAPSLRERAAGQGIRVVEYYGAAELSFVGWRDDDGPFRAFPGAKTRVGGDGRLWVRSPYVARRYLQPQPGASWQESDGWHTVGDLAEPAGEGWRLRGRGDLAVSSGGHTVVVADVESALRQVVGVADVVVVGVRHDELGEIVAAVVRAADDDVPGLRGRLDRAARELPSSSRPRRWLRAQELPTLSSGKVDRAAVRDLASTLPRLV